MKIENVSDYTNFLIKVSESVRQITLNNFIDINETNIKNDKSPVTKYDLEVEKMVRTLIFNEFPDHNIIGEEFGDVNKESKYTWIVDPIDGTKSFLVGRPLWGTMIALMYKYKPIVSMVDVPSCNQLWIAYNNKLILNGVDFIYKDKDEFDFEDVVFASTAPELFEMKNLKKINYLIKNVKFNIWSGDCYNYLSLVQGKIDLVVEENLKCWDILPIIPIINSIGLIIRDWQGNEIIFDGDKDKKFSVIATNQNKILKEAIKFLN